MDPCSVPGEDPLDVPNGDPASYCRLCLSGLDIEELFPDGQEPRQDVIDRIHQCTGIQITPDEDYPSSVCWMCSVSLEEFQCFRERCCRTDGVIRRKRKALASNGVGVGAAAVANPLAEYDVVIRDDDGSFDDYDDEDDDYEEDQPPPGAPLLRIAAVQERFEAQHSNENSLLEPSSYQPADELETDIKPDQQTLDAYAEHFRSANSSSTTTTHRETAASTPNEDLSRVFNCDKCDKSFYSRSNLWSHSQLHAGNLPFPCDDCGTTFGRVKSLMAHKKRYHSKDSTVDPPLRLKCEYCPRLFPREGDRTQHQKKAHPTMYASRHGSTERRPSTAASSVSLSLDRSTPAATTPVATKQITASPVVSEPSSQQNPQHNCTMCTETNFKTAEALEDHVQAAHPKDSILTCSLCPKTFKSRQTLRMHILNHQGKLPHKCEDCGSRFDRKFYLAKHRERYHNSANASTVQCRLKCKFCPRMFIRKTDRKTHTRMVHRDEIRVKREKLDVGYGDVIPSPSGQTDEQKTPLPSSPPPLIPLATATSELSFGCLRCGEQFPSAEMLREHTEDQHLKKPSPVKSAAPLLKSVPKIKIKQEPGLAGPPPLKMIKKVRRSDMLTTNSRRPYKCPYCPKSFSRHYVMKEHTFIHTGSLRFRCDECLAMFNRPHYLRQHKIKYHSVNSRLKFRAMKCQFCSRSFVRMQDIRVHERIAHGVEQKGPLEREIVGEPVNGGGAGEAEEDYDDDEGDYDVQPIVDAEIRDVVVTLERIPDDVLQTLDTSYEDGDYGEELSNDVASSSIAPSETVPRARLNMNITLHRCPKCCKVFKTRKSLKHHMIYHQNQLPFSCDECGVQFARNRPLQIHKQKYHSEDAPYTGVRYSCDYCPRIFLRDRDKLFHQKTVHSMERSYFNRDDDEPTPELKKPKIKKRKDYVCLQCCERFETEKSCQRHINVQHPVEVQSRSPAQSPIPAMMVTPKLEPAEVVAPSEEAAKPPEDVKPPENDPEPSSEDVKPAIPDAPSTTPAQQQQQPSQAAVIVHVTSPGLRPYKLCRCTTCVAIFKNRDNWTAHVQQHPNVRPHHCEQCLIKRKAGRSNRKVTSVGYKCQQCPKVFSTANSLQVHQRLHTSDLRFPCDECDMKFDRYRLLQTHKDRYHSEDAMQQPPPEVFRCQFCTRTFMRQRDCRFHMESVHAV